MRHHHHGGCGRGPRGFARRVPDRETWLRRLEERQRDLEQEIADVTDLIRHLRGEAGGQGTPQPAGTV